jgi:DNA-binding LacI/PurR family transcriptional regulator
MPYRYGNVVIRNKTGVRMVKLSKHESVYQDLKVKLVEFAPNDAAPSVRDLMRSYSVSQATVTRAVSRLCDEGLLVKNAGSGTFVTEEVLKYKQDAAPVIVAAIPRWDAPGQYHMQNLFETANRVYDFTPEVIHFDWQDGIPKALPDRKIDGLMVMPSATTVTPGDIDILDGFAIPYAVVGQHLEGLQVNAVYCDSALAGAQAADHLIKLGHQQLAVVISEPRITPIMNRVDGFSQYCELQGVECRVIDCQVKEGGDNVESVYQKMKWVLTAGNLDFSGVFVTSEVPALGLYKALYEHGLTIPGDVSVVGFGNVFFSSHFYPALTTLDSCYKELVNGSIEIILDRIAHSGGGSCVQRKIKLDLIVRESTCSPTA